jgi:hypothetical protein
MLIWNPLKLFSKALLTMGNFPEGFADKWFKHRFKGNYDSLQTGLLITVMVIFLMLAANLILSKFH